MSLIKWRLHVLSSSLFMRSLTDVRVASVLLIATDPAVQASSAARRPDVALLPLRWSYSSMRNDATRKEYVF